MTTETFPLTIQKQSKKGDASAKIRIYRTESAKGFVSYQVADTSSGVRKLISVSDLEAAKAKASAICDEILSRVKGEEAVVLRGDDRLVYETALKNLGPTGAKLDAATFVYAKIIDILGGVDRAIEAATFFATKNPTSMKPKPVRECVNEFLEAKKRGGDRKKGALRKRSIEDLRYRLNSFADAFQCDIGKVTSDQIQSWLDKKDLSARSYINFKRVLGTLFNYAKRKKFLFKDHDELDNLESVDAVGSNVEIYTPEEMSRLLAAAPKRFIPCLVLGAFCGLRSTEVEKLEWKNVRTRAIIVSADKAKTKTRRVAPIPDNAASWLQPYIKKSGRVWKGTHDEFYDLQQETAAATKTDELEAVTWKSNALRHSFVTYRLMSIDDVNRVALEAGNSSGMIHQHYKELLDDKAEAVKWFSIQPVIPANVTQMKKAG